MSREHKYLGVGVKAKGRRRCRIQLLVDGLEAASLRLRGWRRFERATGHERPLLQGFFTEEL